MPLLLVVEAQALLSVVEADVLCDDDLISFAFSIFFQSFCRPNGRTGQQSRICGNHLSALDDVPPRVNGFWRHQFARYENYDVLLTVTRAPEKKEKERRTVFDRTN